MAIPNKPTLTSPPPAPVRGEDQNTFANKANALVAWHSTNVTDLTDAIDWQDTVFTEVDTRAGDAETAASDAESALNDTLSIAGFADERHQGAHSSAPSTRNDGTALQDGDFYYDTTDLKTYIFDGS